MKVHDATPVSEEAYQLAEGPVWDPERQRLLWVDIQAGDVLVGELDSGDVRVRQRHTFDGTVGAVTCAEDGRLLVAGRQQLLLTDAAGAVVDTMPVIAPDREHRLNDGGCDPAGRFLIGSMALDGRVGDEVLCRLEADGALTVLDHDLTVSNGLAWSPDGGSFYSIDSEPGTVWVRAYDAVTGEIGQRSVLLRVEGAAPDGMCTDADGNLWIAVFGAAEVRCHSPSGEQVATIRLDAPNPTSVAFVGRDLDALLITTARHELSARELEAHPDSGRLFLADVGVRGLPVPLWDGRWQQPG
jgi:sugar lactone lactonase YvrE